MAQILKTGTGKAVEDEQLRQFKIFNEVDLDRIRPLLNSCQKQTFPIGAVLLQPERSNNNMYLLLSGRVSVSLESLDLD